MVSGLEHMSYKEMLRGMDLSSLAKRCLRRGLKSARICTKCNDKDNGAKLSTLVASYRRKILIFTGVSRFVSSGA